MTRRADRSQTPVIVLNWNGWEDTFKCLRSLANASDVASIWLVDNGSTTDRSDEAAMLWPGLRVISLGQNFGFSGGMNRAMRIAAEEGYSFAYLLNNDCAVVPGFLDAALDAARDCRIAVVGSRIGYAREPGFLCFDGQYYSPGEKVINPSSSVRSVPVVNGAGMLVRLAAVTRHGFFDERFFCYHEEEELCRRLIAAGWSCAIADASLILHKREGSDVNGNAMYYRLRNNFLLARSGHGVARIQLTLDAWRTGIAAGEKASQDGRRDQFQTVATALYDGLRGRFGRRLSRDNRATGFVVLRVLIALRQAFRWLSAPLRWAQ